MFCPGLLPLHVGLNGFMSILQVLIFFAGALLEKQIVFVCSDLVCLVAQIKSVMIL